MIIDDPFDKPARVLELNPENGRRILAVSDIHGNLPYFKGVLEKAGFCDSDILIIDGDFLEKGPDSLGTVRYIMELSKKGNVYTVSGNCDDWARFFVKGNTVRDEYILGYLRRMRYGILYEILQNLHIDPDDINHVDEVKQIVYEYCPDIWQFIATLWHAVETPRFIFAHASVLPGKSLREHTAGELFRHNAYMSEDVKNEKWVVAGHWPVVLYHENIVNANPIINYEKKIISIDGGCVLKDDGQLNCLIIPDGDSEDFSFVSYDSFPEYRVLSAQKAGEKSYYIRWGDSDVQVLERGEEFSRCRHVRTGYEMDILTKYLFCEDEITGCNDCTDYVLPLEAGDIVSLVETSSRGCFVKHKGISGWYFGELEKI